MPELTEINLKDCPYPCNSCRFLKLFEGLTLDPGDVLDTDCDLECEFLHEIKARPCGDFIEKPDA